MRVQSLGQEDPLEKEVATHSSILAWRIPWTEEPGGLQSIGHKESDRAEATWHSTAQCKIQMRGLLFKKEKEEEIQGNRQQDITVSVGSSLQALETSTVEGRF